jgi:hypothetical protein
MNDDDPRHGTVNGYGNLKCRCDRCREAWRDKHYEYMQLHPEQREKARERNRAYRVGVRGGPPRTPLEVELAAARHLEQRFRAAHAGNHARRELADRHRDEYRTLYQAFRVRVDAERGPLPGDEPS